MAVRMTMLDGTAAVGMITLIPEYERDFLHLSHVKLNLTVLFQGSSVKISLSWRR